MIWTLLHRTLLIAAAAAASLLLVLNLGTGQALAIWAIIATLACIAGTVLLITSALGRVTWKNRLASYLIPWGARLNCGRLWPIPVVSWLIWMLIAGAVAVQVAKREAVPEHRLVLLFVAWIVNVAAALYLTGTLTQRFEWRSRNTRTLFKLLVGIVVLMVMSVLFLSFDDARTALLIADGPPTVLASFFGLYFGVLIVVGRNARWN